MANKTVYNLGRVELQPDGWYAVRGEDGCVDTLCRSLDAARLHLIRAAFDTTIIDLSTCAAIDSEWSAKACTALREAANKLPDRALAQRCAALAEIKEDA